MKIRDIQNFRYFYKTGVRKTYDQNRDENFVGSSISSNNRTKFGFFDIYHGDKAEKSGIEGFLRGFLDMAQDSQAIYEFLQNAVDANSTIFEMYYDEDYFLAFNNGSQFNFEGIRSILNVGVSTKSQDSSNIGKFGIGFKLIHRLVGEKSGLEELKNLSGPILFSWGNSDQLKELENFNQNSDIDFEIDTYYHIKDSNGKFGNIKNLPWLFKILLTNFPCQPLETIKDLNYQDVTNAFTKEDLVELAQWIKNKIKIDISKHSLDNGSLFFLKLGKNKNTKLSNKKIEDGIQFSLSILNHIAYYQKKKGISQIRINEGIFESKKLFFENFIIKFGSDEYNTIKPQRRNEEDYSDIETLVGFMDYKLALKEIKGNPNFYLFFPLSEEVHNISFIIHSTGFYNASQRTNLQGNESSSTENKGINEALLKIITEKIKQKLLFYQINTPKDKKFRYRFLNIYSNLLLSNKATENHKSWVNNCFIEPIFNILKLQIPTEYGYSDNPKNVKIKATFLPIQPSDLDCPEIEWFVWLNEKYDKILIDEACSSEKLHLEKWDIIDLLKYAISKGKIEIINDWVKKAHERYFADTNNKDYTYYSFLQEVDKNISAKDFLIISQIKLFKFSDSNYYSLNEIFADPNLILIYEKILNIKWELGYLGFIISDLNISYKYQNLFEFILPKISEEALFKAIVEKNKGNNLNAKQKLNLFFTVANFDKIGLEKLKDLELFRDTQGNIRPLRTLLKGNLDVPHWLFSFKIHISEYVPELDKYLVKENEIYPSIIYKNWDFIITLKLNNKNDFYAQVTNYFKQNSENPKLEKLSCIFTNDGFKTPDKIFFNINLNNFDFDDLQNAIFKISNKPTPSKLIFDYITNNDSPFKISKNESISNLITSAHTLTHTEVLALLKFAKLNNEKLFSFAYLQKENDSFVLTKHNQDIYQYHSAHPEINKLLSNHPNFKLLPKGFYADNLQELGILQEKPLYMKVLQILDFSESLLPIVNESDKEVKLAYLEKIKTFSLQEGITYAKDSFEHNCLKLAIDCYGTNFEIQFAPKILINKTLRIKDIAVKDDISFGAIKLSLSSVLPDYKGISDIITNIINQFKGFSKTELDNFFPIKNKDKNEIYLELQEKFPVLQNIEQLGFLLFYSVHVKKNCFTNQSLSILPPIDILEYAYKQNFTQLAQYIDIHLQDKIYPSELALETEKLPNWVLTWLEGTAKQEKLNFLSTMGVHIENSSVCIVRNFFKTGEIIDIHPKIVNLSQDLLLNSLKWLQVYTFKASEYIKIQALTQIFNRLSYTNTIPLLYISQITESEMLYNLEVSSSKKYYFTQQQKEYSQKIFAILQSKGFKLIVLDYFKHWQSSISDLNEIEIKECLDIVTLKNNSTEWDDDSYKLWKENQKYKVAIYKGEKLPYKILFLENEINLFSENTSIEQEGIIYVCESVLHDIRNQLIQYINSDELIKLYQLDNINVPNIQSLQNRISELEELLKQFQAPKNEIPSDTFFDDFDQVVTEKEYNLATGYKAEAYVYEQLKSKGFKNVVWTNQSITETNRKIISSNKTYFIDEKGEPYDLTFTDDENKLCYVQVKATVTTFDRADDVKMIITKREWLFSQEPEYKDVYYMARVFSARNDPNMKFFKMQFRFGT